MRRLMDMKEEDIWYIKHTKCLMDHRYCPIIIFNVMKDLYNIHPKSENGTLDVDIFYRAVKINSSQNEKVKNKATTWPANFELNNCDTDMHTTIQQLDIKASLYFIKDIIYCNFDNYCSLPKSILKHIEKLIKLRNGICHENSLNLFENLFIHIQDICNIMAKSFDVQKKYEYLLHNFKTLFEKLRDYNENQFIIECPKNVIKVYNNLFGTKIKKSAFEVVFKECKEKFFKPHLLDMSNNPKVHSSTFINYEDIFKNNNLAIIMGEAGSGKTTLCEKFVLSFCHSEKPSSDYDLVLLVDVKNVKKGATLYQYLMQVFFKDTFNKNDEKLFYFYLRKLNILFIIDDYDEKSVNSVELLDELFKAFSNKHFLLTTKTYYAEILSEKLKGEFYVKPLKIKLKGLNNIKDLSLYINPCIPDCFENYYGLSTDLKESMKAPAISMLLLYVILNSKNVDSFKTLTLTAMFIQIHKLQRKILLSNSDEGINKKIDEIYKYCFDAYNKPESRRFYIDDVIDVSHLCNRDKFFQSLFKPSLNLWNINHDPFNNFEMIHESLAEFFASYYIFLSITDDKNPEKIFSSDILKKRSIFSHFVGILYHEKKLYNYFDSVVSILETTYKDDINLHWEILSQTMCIHPTPDKRLCRFFSSRLLPRCLQLNDETVESGVSLIAVATEYYPKEIKITLENFLQILNFEKVGNRKLRKCKLILKTNYYHTSNSSFPIFLNPNWITLISFEGIVNNEDLKVLAQFKFLESLKIKLNIDVLGTLVTKLASNNMRNLKELCLIFKEPFSEDLQHYANQLLGKETKVVIEFLDEKKLSCTIHALKQLKDIFTRKMEGATIRLHANLSVEEELDTVEEHFRALRDIIKDDLTVYSRREERSMHISQLRNALGNINFKWRLKR